GDLRDRGRLVVDVHLEAVLVRRASRRAGRRAHLVDALFGLRVRGEEAVLGRLILVAIVETRQEVGERRRFVADLLRQLDRYAVGIELVATVEGVLENDFVRLVRDLVEKGPTI